MHSHPASLRAQGRQPAAEDADEGGRGRRGLRRHDQPPEGQGRHGEATRARAGVTGERKIMICLVGKLIISVHVVAAVATVVVTAVAVVFLNSAVGYVQSFG